MSTMKRRRSLRADQFKALTRSSSNDSVIEKNIIEKVSVNLSIIQLLLNLYTYITTENVEQLIRPTVRAINAFCREPNGSVIMLTQLQRTTSSNTNHHHNHIASKVGIKSKRTNSAGTKLPTHATTEPIMNTNMDGLFLYPLVLPIKESKGNFDVGFALLL